MMVRKGFVLLFALLFSFTILCGYSKAEKIENPGLEDVTKILLHPKIVKALKGHYGGITQFDELELVKVVSRQLPADFKDDSSFKSPGKVYDITVQLDVVIGEGKKEKVTIILSNEFSSDGFGVVSFETSK